MTAEDFNAWLAFMKLKKLAASDAACARLLGVSANTLIRWKQEGTSQLVALACAALIDKIPPWKNEHVFR